MNPIRLHRCFSRHGLAGVAFSVALGVFAHAAHADTIDFTAPLNGWRNSAGDEARYTQDVHYPAVAVSTPEGQSVNALIAGHIKASPKAKPGTAVGTLVVNGTPMPQRIEEDGTFSRPFAFGAGSNSVELRTADGTRKRVQFYDAYTGKTQARLRIVLAFSTSSDSAKARRSVGVLFLRSCSFISAMNGPCCGYRDGKRRAGQGRTAGGSVQSTERRHMP